MATFADRLQGAFRVVLRNAGRELERFGARLRSNSITGPAYRQLEAGVQTFRSAGGLKGVAAQWGRAGDYEARAAEAAERARIARAIGAPWEAELYEREAEIFQSMADTASRQAMRGVGALAAAPARAAWGWFIPQPAGRGRRDWGGWGRRMFVTGGGLFGVGTAYRWLTGTGGPFTNERGDFDIAGIPFV